MEDDINIGKWAAIIITLIVLLIIGSMWAYPAYNIYAQRSQGQAALEAKGDPWQLASDLERERNQLMRTSARLVVRLRAIHDDPEYMAAWECAHNHRGQYRGPQYVDELVELEEVIVAAQGLGHLQPAAAV
jgi:hypothetical protein